MRDGGVEARAAIDDLSGTGVRQVEVQRPAPLPQRVATRGIIDPLGGDRPERDDLVGLERAWQDEEPKGVKLGDLGFA
jgi:hypothetical protein